ncbi:MAG: metallophosphoesterase family protein [Anaerolineae bacterium]
MTRIIMLSDTHHGGGPEGYRMQACYIHRLRELLAALGDWISETGGADLILHGGDTVERSEPDLISGAVAQLTALPVPVRLALGNHDMTTRDALALWQELAGDLLPGGQTAYGVSLDDCTVHVLPAHWGIDPYYWDGGPPRATLYQEDLETLEARLASEPGRPQIVLCHAAPGGVPTAQTGRAEEGDPPPVEYRARLRGLAERHPDLRLFMSGHSHINALGPLGSARWLTASSYSESPFECKEITVTSSSLRVRTVAMHARLEWRADYDWNAAYVQGRPGDRALELAW